MIKKQTIELVQDAADIEGVVGEFVNLKKRGANRIGLCPFHDEKTPSFIVSPAKGIYKCFGCGKGGDSIGFIMEHESMSYPEAIRFLAGKFNIEIDEVVSEEDKTAQQERDSLYIINTYAKDHFQTNLLESDEGQNIGLSYFHERGYREEMIKKFDLGYSMDSFSHLLDDALSKQYKEELLERLGLVKQKNGKTFDFFRGRVMFPIHNVSGKIIAFAGRVLKKDEKTAKYINSPETEIYHKSKVLYGMHLAKGAIRKLDECLLVEGYTDVISLHQAGVENVVASSGTSLTEGQISLVRRFTENITILYDGDSAGVKAALRGLDLILEQNLNVKVVLLPEGEDPDSFMKLSGHSAFTEFISKNAKDFILFKTDMALAEVSEDPVKKGELVRDIIKSISKIPDPLKRTIYIQSCSKRLGISEEILIRQINKEIRSTLRQRNKYSDSGTEYTPGATPDLSAPVQEELSWTDRNEILEKDIIRLLLSYGDKNYDEAQGISIQSYVMNQVAEIEFRNSIYQEFINDYIAAYNEDKMLTLDDFKRHQNEEVRMTAINIIAEPNSLSENWMKKYYIETIIPDQNFLKDVQNLMDRFSLNHVQNMIQESSSIIKETKDDEELQVLLRKHQDLVDLKIRLAKRLDTVTLG